MNNMASSRMSFASRRVRSSLRLLRLWSLAALCCVGIPPILLAGEKRPFTLEEMFKIEALGWRSRPAPDGSAVAIERVRPLAGVAPRVAFWTRSPGERVDIWLVPTNGEPARNLTHGDLDGSSSWSPVWSPDSQRLAFVSSNGAEESSADELNRMRAWIWNRQTSKLSKLSVKALQWDYSQPSFVWVDSHRLLLVRCPGRKTDLAVWAAARDPQVTAIRPLVSAIETAGGRDRSDILQPPCDLVLVDTDLDSLQVLSSATGFRDMIVAPIHGAVGSTRARVAVLEGAAAPRTAVAIDPLLSVADLGPPDLLRYRVKQIDFDRSWRPSTTTFDFAVMPGSVAWARDGSRFAALGHTSNDPNPGVAWSSGGAPLLTLLPPDITAQRLFWTADNRLVVAGEVASESRHAKSKRYGLWLLPEQGGPVRLAESVSVAPENWTLMADGRLLIGVADRELWRLDLSSKALTNLTATFDPSVMQIAWPAQTLARGRNDAADAAGTVAVISTTLAEVVGVNEKLKVSARSNAYQVGSMRDGRTFVRCDIMTGALTPIGELPGQSELISYHTRGGGAIFISSRASDLLPDSVMLRQANGQWHTLMSLNSFLDEISGARMQPFVYSSMNGESLVAWLLLPPDYEATHRYPLVTYVYAGREYQKDRPPWVAALNNVRTDQPQLLASHGYVVLLPSMPVRQINGRGEPFLDLLSGVMPALQATIDMGIADPDRLAVIGHSFGGFSVYGIITQTTRFKAAIATAGAADLLSRYGTFTHDSGQEPRPDAVIQDMLENGQYLQGVPPWRDSARYLRNSPLLYVDRITTPVLIVQGNDDFVRVTQGEEFFSALQREGKRARFLRYWAEGHEIVAAANLRNLWHEIYAWLDELTGSGETALPPKISIDGR
jgi:dipeptidyl aminopeptidase/acylaminoacyl peptidase